MFPPAADGTVQKGNLKLQMGGKGGTATLHIPKILSFGEVKISAYMQKKPHDYLTGH
jgi:hypothetical protein